MNDLFTDANTTDRSVECLGLTFPSEHARRDHFLKLLETKLRDPAFREREGFPQGSDEAILALSDPPFFTASPNPFMEEFLRLNGNKNSASHGLSREPFVADVSEGKNDPVYMAHSYHTKVPHKAIMRYILHYTDPGDVVFDGFCGSGMTGVAAHACGDRHSVEELGYRVLEDGAILKRNDDTSRWEPFSKLGTRVAILGDLSPAAAFIAYNYNSPIDPLTLEKESRGALASAEKECGWMFETLHQPTSVELEQALEIVHSKEKVDLRNCGSIGRINYTLWSDVFLCPECAREFVFWDAAVDKETNDVLDCFECPGCGVELTKARIDRAWTTQVDPFTRQNVQQVKQVPALISYVAGTKKFDKKPDAFDLALLDRIASDRPTCWTPNVEMMFTGERWGDSWRAGVHSGITHVHHFYSLRNLYTLASFRHSYKNLAHAVNLTSTAIVASRLYRFRSQGGSLGAGGGPMSGTLYIPSLVKEIPALKLLDEHTRRAAAVRRTVGSSRTTFVQTASMSDTGVPDDSVDYLFLDPPFGANLMYSELNFIWEAWLQVFTDTKPEAIENKTQQKGVVEYRRLMSICFAEAYRILKPGRWVTVEFSNTQAAIWNSIQIALQEAGFVVANVSALDKKQGSFKAVTTTTAVKQDLVISAYKPNGELEERFSKTGGGEDSVWDFVRTHLGYLPTVKLRNGVLGFIAERDPRIIFDRMVAWFVRHNVPVPMSTHEFQAGLTQRFVGRDGMIFLPDQVTEYDKKRMQAAVAPQMEFFVSDERSAIDWLADFLKARPSTYQEIHPEFIKQLGGGWKRHEAKPELANLLEINFLKYDGAGDVPSQIHSYLSTNYKDLRGLAKSAPQLSAKALERWYVPDPTKAIDLEKKRDKALMKEFALYEGSTGRKLKEFRLEVLRAGFKAAWTARDYKTIISVAQKIPDEALLEDEKLLLWYDQALTRSEDSA